MTANIGLTLDRLGPRFSALRLTISDQFDAVIMNYTSSGATIGVP